jgi:hypothetical protein
VQKLRLSLNLAEAPLCPGKSPAFSVCYPEAPDTRRQWKVYGPAPVGYFFRYGPCALGAKFSPLKTWVGSERHRSHKKTAGFDNAKVIVVGRAVLPLSLNIGSEGG